MWSEATVISCRLPAASVRELPGTSSADPRLATQRQLTAALADRGAALLRRLRRLQH
jgi:hypothetical protein